MEVFDEDNTSDKLIGAAQLSLKDFQVGTWDKGLKTDLAGCRTSWEIGLGEFKKG